MKREMNSMLFMGVDLGTSSMKVLLINENGEIINTASREYPLEFPKPGWSQQNPADWWKAFCECTEELFANADKNKLKAIAVSGQMHGLVALDKDDNIIRPAILWNDGRTQNETDEINSHFGMEKLLSLTGNIAFAGFTAPKIVWMYNNERELFDKISKIMLPKDYINYSLTGVHSADFSDAAGTLLLDVKNRCWSKEMLDYCHVEQSQLGKLFESYESVGTIKKEIADLLGLPQDVIVAAGGGDNACSAIGTGTIGDNKCNISLGTSGTVFISSKDFKLPPKGNLHSFCDADGHYHLMGCILSAASSFGWWSKTILKAAKEADEQQSITDEMLGNNHVYYLPYLMGERSPHNDALARGAFIGLTLDTTREQMSQAVLEGVAFAIRDCVEIARSLGLPVDVSGVCGGGAKSPLWRKILANVLKTKLEIAEQEQGAGMGAGMGAGILAMVAAGVYSSNEQAFEKIKGKTAVIEYDEAISKKYDERYEAFKKLYPSLKEAFPAL